MKSLRYRIIAGVCILTCLIAGCGTAESDRNAGGRTDAAKQNAAGDSGQNSGSLDGKDLTWQASYSSLERRYAFALAAEQLYGAYYRDGQNL